MGAIVGADVGGTFTDLVLIDAATGALRLAKVPTTPENQAEGVLAALDAAGADCAALDLVVHGTTATTNAVLERRFARTGLITTEGFRDVLELGRRTRPKPYGMTGTHRPVIPRDLRLEVPERMDAEGEVVVPLDLAAVAAAGRRLLDAGCEAVVVHFLHCYANPAHERAAAETLRGFWPNDYVTTGSELLGESREYERGVTAAVNASVRPLLERYLARLRAALAARGHRGDLLVMNGNGGMVSAAHVAREAAKTVMSGPASGVIAAAAIGRAAGAPDLLTFDMGGTSTDVALIRGAAPAVSAEIEVDYGLPIHVPMVDVRTVGAGGGSILRVGAGGLLEVGPESAGAAPGPICYGRGGLRPTISDANFLLGRLDPSGFTAGAAREAVAAIFAREIGAPLGLDAFGAAEAAIRVADAKMAGAVRMVSVSLGADPRDFALFPFGGAGPLHALAIARELSIPRVLVPARPGVVNALGCALADLRHDFTTTLGRALDSLDEAELHAVLADHEARGAALLDRERAPIRARLVERRVEMRFMGQSHLLPVPLDDARPTREGLRAGFASVYFARFGIELPGQRVDLVNVMTSVIGARPPLDLTRLIDPAGRAATLGEAEIGRRPVRFGADWIETPVWRRERLPAGAGIEGPAVIAQMDATTLLHPGDRARADGFGNLMVEVGP